LARDDIFNVFPLDLYGNSSSDYKSLVSTPKSEGLPMHLQPHYWVHRINYAVPLPRGRWLLQRIARNFGELPIQITDVRIDHGLLIDLDLRQWVDMCVYFNLMDPEIKRAIDDFVHAGDITLDIGANIGYYSLLMAHRVGAKGQVHSFEPNPAVCERLRNHATNNQLDRVIDVHNKAVADEEGVLNLYTYEGNAGLSSIAPYPGRAFTSVETQVQTLDALFQSGSIGIPSFIKIDVEGAELLVLKGAESLVQTARPVIVAEIGHYQAELFGYSANDIWKWANERDYEYLFMDPLKGYRLAASQSDVRLLPGEEHGNVLLRPKQ
jgi:FkbM family methyltransferase